MDFGPPIFTDPGLHAASARGNILPAPEPCATLGCQGEVQVGSGEQVAPVGGRHQGILPLHPAPMLSLVLCSLRT